MLLITIQFIMAFLMGSIPFGVLVCEALGLKSPKTYGSGNIGASNVARQNKIAGAITLILDAAKGYLAIKLCSPHDIILLAVVLGHCYSPLLSFNGGKGIATYGGALIALNPPLAVTLGAVWFIRVLDNKPAVASFTICLISIVYAVLTQRYLLMLINLIILLRHKDNVSELQKS